MTKKNQDPDNLKYTGEGEPTPDAADDQQTPPDAEPGDPPTPEQRIAELEAEKQELEEKLLRMSADYQNFARRSQRDSENARQQQVVDVAKHLVGVLDNFDRALETDPDKVAAKDVLAGVRMVREEFMRALGKVGVERLDATPGEPLDPNRHEALMHQPSDQYEANHVVMQFQPGYILSGQKVIRAAKVAVAAPPPEAGAPEAPPQDAESPASDPADTQPRE